MVLRFFSYMRTYKYTWCSCCLLIINRWIYKFVFSCLNSTLFLFLLFLSSCIYIFASVMFCCSIFCLLFLQFYSLIGSYSLNYNTPLFGWVIWYQCGKINRKYLSDSINNNFMCFAKSSQIVTEHNKFSAPKLVEMNGLGLNRLSCTT